VSKQGIKNRINLYLEDTVGSQEDGQPSGMADVVEGLQHAGVSRIYGTSAVAGTPLYGALMNSHIEVVLATNDTCSVFMADTHGRITGHVGVCAITRGSSMAAFEGLAEALLSDSPVIVLLVTGETAFDEAGRGMTPDHKQMAAIGSLCRAVFRVRIADEVPMVLAQALRTAYEGEPGPVLVEIPTDIRHTAVNMKDVSFLHLGQTLSAFAETKLEQVVTLIESASTVGFLVGPGCFSAEEELVHLAEQLEAPVASTGCGLGVLPFIHPLSVGPATGPVTSLAKKALSQCELVLVVGCKVAEPLGDIVQKLPGKLVYIDSASNQPSFGVPADVVVQAPVEAAIRFLSNHLQPREGAQEPGMRELIRHEKRKRRQEILDRPARTDAVDPVKFFVTLRELLSGEDVLILDNGPHAGFGIGYYSVQAPRTLLMPLDYGTQGFSVPAAIAATLALPDKRVVSCVEEQGFWLSGMELLTARRCDSAPLVVVFCDTQVGIACSPDDCLLQRSASVKLLPVDYEALARALGVHYVCIRNDQELEAGLRQALTIDAAVVVELRVSYLND
jgi:acetolactate synthase-1/2/3 large subunit